MNDICNDAKLIKVDANEFHFDWRDTFDGLDIGDYCRYPSSLSSEQLKNSIKDINRLKNSEISLGNGSDDILFRLLFANRGCHIAVFRPSYPYYAKFALMNGCRVTGLSLSSDYNLPDNTAEIIKILQPKIVFLAYPNNPTGNAFNRKTIEQAISINHKTLFVIDEAYYEFYGDTFTDLIEEGVENVAIIRTFSKAWGLASARIGYCIASKAVTSTLEYSLLPYHINSWSLAVCQEALKRGLNNGMAAVISEVKKERNRLIKALRTIPSITVYPSVTNFIWILDHKKELSNQLKLKNIRAKEFFDIDFGVRLSVGTKSENDSVVILAKRIAEGIND
jgi:histidinol-phosphate aminotransferase